MSVELTRDQILALLNAAEGTNEDFAASGENAPRALLNAMERLRNALRRKR